MGRWTFGAAVVVVLAGCGAPSGDTGAAEDEADAVSTAVRAGQEAAMEQPVRSAGADLTTSRSLRPATPREPVQTVVRTGDGRAPVSPVAASESGLTPGEAEFMDGEAIGAGRFAEAMRGDRWDETVGRFEADSGMDPDARELERIYREALQPALARHDMVLARFGCGLSLCAGTARGPLPEEPSMLPAGLVLDVEGLSMPMRVVREVETPRYRELRFSFSIETEHRTIRIGR